MPTETKTKLSDATLKAVNQVLEQAKAKGLGTGWDNAKHCVALSYLAENFSKGTYDAAKGETWVKAFRKELAEESAWLYASNMKKELIKQGLTKDIAAEYE